MKKIKISVFIILLALITVISLGVAPAAAGDYYGDAQFFSDERGNYYILINNDKKRRLFSCSRTSEISEINCEGFAAEDVYFANGNIYLSRYMDHTLCLFDVLNKEIILLECSPIKNGIFTESDKTLYLCDQEKTNLIKVYKGSRLISTINAVDAVAGLFTDPIEKTVYAAVNDGVFDIKSGHTIKCSVPVFPITYNDGIYTDSFGDMYSFEKDTGFSIIFSTESRSACFCNGCAYFVKDGIVVRTEIESGKTTEYYPEKEIIALSASGLSAAVLTEDEVIFLSEDLFKTETEVSDEPSKTENSVAEKNERSEASEKQKDESKPEIEIPITSEPEETEKYEVPFDFSDGFVRKIPCGTTAAAFRKSMKNNVTIRFRNSSGKVVDKGNIGTGWQIELTEKGITKNYTAVIYGDINGNGIINTADADMVSKYLCDLCELSEAQKYAADMNHDGVIDIRDICRFQEIYYSNGKTIPNNAFM